MRRRSILHVDMDAFFASIAQLDDPRLRGKPVIVGGHSIKRGVVASASYEARAFGVRSAMPLYKAMELCPHALKVTVRMDRYREVNAKLHEIWGRFAPVVEGVGLDEAYLDMTGTEALLGPPEQVAYALRAAILAETHLSASVGTGSSKLLAKIASKAAKPSGVCVVPQGSEIEWLHPRDVGLIPGVGHRTRERLVAMNIRTIGQLAEESLEKLVEDFGAQGADLYLICRGKDPRPVTPGGPPKSMGGEETFDGDSADPVFLRRRLLKIVCELGYRLRKHGMVASTVSAKLRYSKTFETLERSLTLLTSTDDDDLFYETAWTLLKAGWDGKRPLRLVGATLSNLQPNAQLSLFSTGKGRNSTALHQALDKIRGRYGMEAVLRGALVGDRPARGRKKR